MTNYLAVAIQRAPLISLVFTVLVFFYYLQSPSTSTPLGPLVPIVDDYTLHITELGGSHDEVVAAIVNSFASEPHAKLTIYQLLARYGIADLMRNFTLPRPLPKSLSPSRFMDSNYDKSLKSPTGEGIDILVAVTCDIDVDNNHGKLKRLFEEENTHLFCVVHHADRWTKSAYEKALSPWIQKGRVTFLTLSPHTQDYLRDHSLANWTVVKDKGLVPAIEYITPVYPVDLPTIEESVQKQGDSIAFSIQGDYSSDRRDYKRIFGQLKSILDTMNDPSQASSSHSAHNMTLKLLGHGNKPKVPEVLQHNVHFGASLSYHKYYEELADSFAVVPAFAARSYYDRKASSSVPAALIAGVPIIADQLMLDTYRYLTKEAVWFQEEGEQDMDVLARAALSVTPKERMNKKRIVRKLNEHLIKENQEKTARWVGNALKAAKMRADSMMHIYPGARPPA